MPKPLVRVRKAVITEHKQICQIAKQSKYTKDFSNMIFSGENCYAEGRIEVACRGRSILGFTCVRYRKRDSVLVLYFVGVLPNNQNKGIGSKLLEALWAASTGTIGFKVMKDNPAVPFYKKRGFEVVGEAYEGEAWVMRRHKKTPGKFPGVKGVKNV